MIILCKENYILDIHSIFFTHLFIESDLIQYMSHYNYFVKTYSHVAMCCFNLLWLQILRNWWGDHVIVVFIFWAASVLFFKITSLLPTHLTLSEREFLSLDILAKTEVYLTCAIKFLWSSSSLKNYLFLLLCLWKFCLHLYIIPYT